MITITIHKDSTNFPSKFSKLLKKLQEQNWIKLFQFFTKSCDSFCCHLHSSSSWSVLVIHWQTTQDPWLFQLCSTLVIWNFSQLKHPKAEARALSTFLYPLMRLFLAIGVKGFKNNHCHWKVHKSRISWFFKFPYAFCRAFHVEHRAIRSF